MHNNEIMGCQSQIRSLMNDDSTAEDRRDDLEETTEDLKAVVCSLSQALAKLRETYEKDLEEARSKVTQLNKELKNVKSELLQKAESNLSSTSTHAVIRLRNLSFDRFDSKAMVGTFTATTDSLVQAPIEVEAIIKYGTTKVWIHDVNLG